MRKAILLSAIFLTACSTYPQSLDFMKPYKMDIQQGNVVTSKMLLQLRPGMTKAQVRFVMGTPMISDSFHANRWDYLYRMEKNGRLIEQRHVILDFQDEKLKGVRGDVVPAAPGAEAAAATPVSHEPVPVKPASETAPKEKSMLDRLKFWDSDDTGSATPPSGQPPAKEDMQVLPPLMEAPGTAPTAPPVSAEPETAPAPVAPPEQKGLLDKLMFWKDSEPEAAPKAAVRPAAPQLPAIPEKKAEPLPPLTETPPAAAESAPVQSTKPAPEAVPAPQPAAPQSPAIAEEKPKPPQPLTQTPAAAAKPAPAEPQPAAAASTEPQPAAKPAPTAEPKAAPKPQPDLPSEEDPSYFERLLEKIGF